MKTQSSLASPSPTPFYEGQNKIYKKLGRGSNFCENSVGKTKRGKIKKMQRS